MTAPSSPSFRFPQACHIKNGRDFTRLKSQGSRVSSRSVLSNWKENQTSPVSRLGLVVSKKVGNSVVRSRARRLLRECFRLNRARFEMTVDLVLVARPAIADKTFAEVQKDFLYTMRKAGIIESHSGR
jgi:ribonuclease P protein component